MRRSWKRLIAFVITVAMLSALVVPVLATDDSEPNGSVTWEKVSNDTLPTQLALEEYTEQTEEEPVLYKDSDIVSVLITLSDPSTIAAGFAVETVASNNSAISYRQRLQMKQEEMADFISQEVLGGKPLDVVEYLTLLVNIISAEVPYGKIDEIRALPGVESVELDELFYLDDDDAVGDLPMQSLAKDMIGSTYAWANGYYGAGTRVAILDTGLDDEHMMFDGAAFEYAIQEDIENGTEVELLTLEDLEAVWSQLNCSRYRNVTAAGAYRNAKVPFAVNYMSQNLVADHSTDQASEHGSHVAGIAAGNRYVSDGEGGFVSALETVFTQGVAPDAQLIIGDVFNSSGSASSTAYYAAIEDAIILGAASANLSLGSNNGRTSGSGILNNITRLTEAGLVVSISAGNEGSWADETENGQLYSDGVNYYRVGSPGSFMHSLSVASIDNVGFTGTYFDADGHPIFYTETSYGNAPITTLAGTQEYIYVDTIGNEEDFAAVADVLEGRIAICNRGEISFYVKANNAAKYGAAGVLIANNAGGTINMDLTGYEYTIPVVAILQSDGKLLKDRAEKVTDDDGNVLYYIGTFEMVGEVVAKETGDPYYTMSDFSSWGITGDMILKPEITTPGGNIYAPNGYHLDENSGAPAGGHDQFEMMSGTSMAAPQMAEKTGLSARQLIQSLTMSTATPVQEMPNGAYASILKQGAGLANLDGIINAKTYIWMSEEATVSYSDGKVKAELGDDPERTGEYTVAFTINNMTDEEVTYDLGGVIFTQAIDGEFLSYGTENLNATFTWTVNGEDLTVSAEDNLDFNGDGILNSADAVALLDFVVGNRDSIENASLADRDEDGDVDTYDAYLVLNKLNAGTAVLAANASAEVVVTFTLPDMSKYDVDGSGAYVEGFLFVGESGSPDGALGVQHSIPVVGYYGSWTDPSMFDVGTYNDYVSGTETRDPYMYVASGDTSYRNNAVVIRYAGSTTNVYYNGGNPIIPDEVYMPERSAVSGDATLYGVSYKVIRMATAGRYFLMDGEGNLIQSGSQSAPAYPYYNSTNAAWSSYTATIRQFNYSLANVADGDTITAGVSFVPEYYGTSYNSVDWDSIGQGATLSFELTVDAVAPSIDDIQVEGFHFLTNSWDSMTVLASDNNYIAAIRLYDNHGNLLAEQGSDPEAEPGDTYTFKYEPDGESRFLLQVYDYAGNLTTYKINFNTGEQYQDIAVTLLDDDFEILQGLTRQLTVEVTPWGIEDDSVTWTTSDRTVATVSSSGLVTAVGAGVATITVSANADPQKTDSVEVTVKKVDVDLNAIINNRWVSFNTANLPTFTTIGSAGFSDPCGVVVDGQGVIYAFDDDGENTLYTVDPSDYSLTPVGSDADGAPAYGGLAAGPNTQGYLFSTYGPYLVIYTTDGAFEGVIEWSENYLAGITYAGSFTDAEDDEIVWDAFFLVDISGNVYEEIFTVWEGDLYYGFGDAVTSGGAIANMGVTTTYYYYNAVYSNGEYLFWSRYGNNLSMSILDLNSGDRVTSGYAFGRNNRPVVGIFEMSNAAAGNSAPAIMSAAAPTLQKAELSKTFDRIERTVEEITVDSVRRTALPTSVVGETDEENNVTTVTIAADVEQTNGLYTVEYDDTLTLESVDSNVTFNSIKEEEGKVTVGFATLTPVEEDGVIAELSFSLNEGEEYGEIRITTADVNDANPDDFETVDVGEKPAEPVTPVTPTPAPGEDDTGDDTGDDNGDDTGDKFLFDDVQDESTYYFEPVYWAVEQGITNGTSETTFSPDAECTRGQIVTFLYRAAGEPEVNTTENPFTDVVAGSYYEKAVLWAVAEGITNGTSATTFSPDATCTRAQIVTFLYRAFGEPAVTAAANFTDVAADAYYANAVAWAVAEGITTGTSETTFSPDANCIRAQAVTFLYRAYAK